MYRRHWGWIGVTICCHCGCSSELHSHQWWGCRCCSPHTPFTHHQILCDCSLDYWQPYRHLHTRWRQLRPIGKRQRYISKQCRSELHSNRMHEYRFKRDMRFRSRVWCSTQLRCHQRCSTIFISIVLMQLRFSIDFICFPVISRHCGWHLPRVDWYELRPDRMLEWWCSLCDLRGEWQP
jgi:hypothetical protein